MFKYINCWLKGSCCPTPRSASVLHEKCRSLCSSPLNTNQSLKATCSLQTTALESSSTCIVLPALVYLTVLEFLLPLLAVVGFTLRLACFLSTSHGLMPQQSRARRARAVRLLATVLVVFTICFTPFHIRQLLVYLRFKVRGEKPGEGVGHVLAYHVTVTLSSLNSCLDPVVYCFVTDSFKRAWRARRRGAREEGFHGSGRDEERKLMKRCSGTALAIAHSVATLTFPSPPPSVAHMENMEQFIERQQMDLE